MSNRGKLFVPSLLFWTGFNLLYDIHGCISLYRSVSHRTPLGIYKLIIITILLWFRVYGAPQNVYRFWIFKSTCTYTSGTLYYVLYLVMLSLPFHLQQRIIFRHIYLTCGRLLLALYNIYICVIIIHNIIVGEGPQGGRKGGIIPPRPPSYMSTCGYSAWTVE